MRKEFVEDVNLPSGKGTIFCLKEIMKIFTLNKLIIG